MLVKHRNELREKCFGSHCESNPRPLTLAVDTLTTQLRLYVITQHSLSVFKLEKQAASTNDEGEAKGN